MTTTSRLRRSTRSLALFVALVAAFVSVGALVEEPSTVDAARAWYVAPSGDDTASGSAAAPLKTIGWAVRRAGDGDVVILRGGTYREQVYVYGKTVHIRSAGGERAVLDGSIPVEGWKPDRGAWFHDGWTKQFHREPSGGTVPRTNIVAGYPDQLFVDGRPLRQVLRRDDVGPGTFWHDTDGDRLWVGDDPSGHLVEASRLGWGVYFNRADGSTLTDVTVRRYGTERRNMAAIRGYADDLVFDGVTAEYNARIGLSLIGNDIVVRDGRFSDNGFIGVHADGVETLVLERLAVTGNNKAGFDSLHSAAGIKVTSSRGVTVRDSDVSRNDGPGIWTDLDTNWVTVANNLVERNGRAGIEVELSYNVNVLSNVALDNKEAGIWILESSDVNVLHNASYDNQNAIEIEDGPRRDVRNVSVHNNVLGRGKGGSRALLDVNDWTGQRSASEMGVSVRANAFWVPSESGTPILTRWAQWPSAFGYARDLDGLFAVTGQGAGSIVSTDAVNPFVRSVESFDYRTPSTIGAGTRVYGGAADDLGVPNGSRPRIGPIGAVVRR